MKEKNKYLSKKYVYQTLLHICIILLLLIMLYPLAMAVWNAFKAPNDYIYNKWAPSLPLRIKNLSDAFAIIKDYMGNTLFVAAIGIPGMVILASMASFAMARTKIIGRNVAFYLIIFTMMVPGVLTLVPSYVLYKGIGLYDSLFSLIIPIWTGGSVFAVFLLMNMFKSIPVELFEAARVDGAALFRQYLSIALPLSMPIIGTVVIMSIVNIWNDIIWPTLILQQESYTISAGLNIAFYTVYEGQEPVMYSGYLLASLPLIVLFVAANRFYIQGLMGTAIKL